jgi:hypothetical protein
MSRRQSILEYAKLGKLLVQVLSGLGVAIGLMLPDMLVKLVERLLELIKERELSTAQKVVLWVLTMFNSYYQGLDRMALSGGWAPGSSNDHCDRLEED